MARAVLVSASSTTGWADWIHGELWVLPDALVRKRLGLGATIRHWLGRTVDPANPPVAEMSDVALRAIESGHPTNVVVKREQTRSARLHVGLTTGKLVLDLDGDVTVKLLWLKHDHAERTLEPLLRGWIGDALQVR